MTSERPRSSASYAYYSFPPTPDRACPPESSKASSKQTSPKTARTSKNMAPSPAAGKTPAKAPTTPTKSGKRPASSSTSKLGAAGGAADTAKDSAPTDTKSPKLPPRPKAGGTPQTGRPKPPKLDKKPVDDTKKQAEDTAEESGDKIDLKDNDPAEEADNEESENPVGKISQVGNETGEEASSAVSTVEDEGEEAVGGIKEAAEGEAEDTHESETEEAEDTAEETADDATGGATGGVTGAAKGAAGKAKGAAGKATDGDIEGAAEEAKEGAEDTAGEAKEGVEETAPDGIEDGVDGVKDTAEGAADEAADGLPDLSVLKGLKVGEGGEILGADGEPLGQLDEGDPEDLVGQEIGDDGEILDEDGDVIGRASVLPDKVQELADKGKKELPGLNVLEGLEVDENGDILGPDGSPLGKLTEGNPEDLAGMTLNDKGEILDEDGDVVGRAEVVPEAADKLEEGANGVEDAADEVGEKAGEAAGGLTPDISILQGKKINKKGKILDEEGEPIGQLTEGSDINECAGKIPNERGLIINEDGDIVGKVEVVPGDAANEAMMALHPELLEEAKDIVEEAAPDAEEDVPQLPGLDILDGLKVNKKGEVLNEDGEPIARVSEGEITELAGKKINANGEVLDKEGNIIGKVELIPEAFPDVPEAEAEKPKLPGLDILEGLKVNKKGEVVNEDGDAVARVSEGELKDLIGKKINDQGEVLDAEGNIIGKVELIPEAFPDAVPEEEQGPDLSVLEGYKVNKNGDVVNEDGETLAKLVEGDLEACRGKKINPQGEVLDKDGNVVGKVELVPAEGEAAEDDTGPELPPLSILEGLKCNKSGKIVDSEGKPLGELIEGDAKKLAKMGAECDAEGQFWDGKGHVIGKAQTLPQEDTDEEAPFAGLEGLIVVPDGWVEDENQNKVGILTEGDPKKLVGRAVDEDGDVLDKRGNVVGHADRYEEPEDEEQKVDLSILEGKAVNKQGNVIGDEGVPIGRLVEGNAKELAGRKCDAEGQIFNDTGKVVGRCEVIPESEREAKPEGPFAGLEGVVVVKDGMVVDEDGNTVGVVVEGDAKRLIGRAVDEDGDIIDKYGNVKGHAEPYEAPEEQVADLSSLEGKVVNKAGNVVDEHGTIFGRIAEGDPAELAGKKVDGQGQIWNDNGKVIGQAELLPGGRTEKPEGPFAGWENLVVAKDGMVTDAAGQIVGKLDDESMPNAEKLLGRKVDEDGEILDKAGNSLGKAIRWSPEEKQRNINPMSGHKVNRDGEVRDENGELLGMVTDGHLPTLVGLEVDDNGYVIDNDGNKVGECTLMQNLQEDQGPTEEEIKKAHDSELAKKMNSIVQQTLEKMQPICKNITERLEKADRTPKEELDEEELVKDVRPMIEEGGRILQECNGALRGLDPDGSIAANAKARSQSGEATPEEHQLANSLKELTSTVVTTIENAKKKLADMPHAKKELNPLWYLLTEPLFQIIAAVGLLLSGVLGLVGKLLNGLGLGGLVNGLLGGLGIDKLLTGLGLGSIGKSLGLGGGKKK
ncbi:hypothetical protein ABVK25_001354 [Lepraria finkii]|uniref:DUF6987 domain-containing protein n=1 Tax=Lepraria finkii TaxID=1340010 RepID=A0ABR4BNP4_9LECA